MVSRVSESTITAFAWNNLEPHTAEIRTPPDEQYVTFFCPHRLSTSILFSIFHTLLRFGRKLPALFYNVPMQHTYELIKSPPIYMATPNLNLAPSPLEALSRSFRASELIDDL
jgi:hypothetical protein